MSNQDPRIDPTRVITPGGGAMDRTMVAAGDMGATQQMASGSDMYRTQMAATTNCPVCKSTTPAFETYCGDCGFLLSSAPTTGPIEIPAEPSAPAELIDAVSGRRYRLREGANTLGRQGTDVVVAEGTVSRVHARILIENGVIVVEDLGSSNGTKVGDRRIGPNQPTQAVNGTPLKFGDWRVTLEVSGATGAVEPTIVVSDAEKTIVGSPEEPGASVSPEEAAKPEPNGPQVAVLKKLEGPTEDIPVYEGAITIGRRPTNTIMLTEDAYISGRHAEIVTENSGTYLTDLGSTNGTAVNGQKLTPNERQLLLDGDEIQLGQGKYRFTILELEPLELDDEMTALKVEEPTPQETTEDTSNSQQAQASGDG